MQSTSYFLFKAKMPDGGLRFFFAQLTFLFYWVKQFRL